MIPKPVLNEADIRAYVEREGRYIKTSRGPRLSCFYRNDPKPYRGFDEDEVTEIICKAHNIPYREG
jgi:hypothetical protein